ncbi:26523_t:CDS:2 [Dentiscutata erythropus]|uniref:26523_t:CDS:1 n=1 Tax=Dentiscutata erythropus TaxID=1348616 RepID=A0A9N9G4Y5_9GLOM|nr:26523_t:CDS:2 [Dentiscutata erythropus]
MKLILRKLPYKYVLFIPLILCLLYFMPFVYRYHGYHDWLIGDHLTTPIAQSTSKCRGEGRATVCEFTNLCVDSKHGAYIVNQEDISVMANVMNSDEISDIFWKPAVRSSYPEKVQYINDTVFIYGLYAPYHFSHWMFNGLLPLYSMMRTYNATRNAWLMRVCTADYQPSLAIPQDISFLTDGKEIVFNYDDMLTEMQVMPPTVPICFANAVVGAGNLCSLIYCEKNIPAEHYEQFRNDILNYFIHNGKWENYMQKEQADKRVLSCINNTKIYTPDNGDINIENNANTPVIGVLQRYRNRYILNAEELINALVNQKYTVKFFNFDIGCSLPATAKLLEDVDILITSHGNGIGDAIFMAPKTTVISIDSRFYSEAWFTYVHTASGRRFYNFQCESSDCQVADIEMAKQVLEREGVVNLTYYELLEFVGPKYPDRLITKYFAGNGEVYYRYAKNATRLVDVDKLVRFVKEILEEVPLVNNKSFVELCEIGKCCGPWCDVAMERNVFKKGNAWGGEERQTGTSVINWKAAA